MLPANGAAASVPMFLALAAGEQPRGPGGVVEDREEARELDHVELVALDRELERRDRPRGDAEAAHEPLILERAQRLQRTALAEDRVHVLLAARIMDHHQLDLLDAEILEALLGAALELLGREALAVTELGRDDEIVGHVDVLEQLSEALLIGIGLGRVEEVDAGVEGRLQHGDEIVVVADARLGRARVAEAPRAERQLGDLEARPAENRPWDRIVNVVGHVPPVVE